MNQQSPQQQPASQSQGNQQPPPGSHKPRPKNSRKMSTGERAALISATGAIVVAIITAILGPIIISHFSGGGSTPTLNPTPSPTPNTGKNLYPPYTGTLVLNDPLLDNSHSKGYEWENYSVNAQGDAGCQFTKGGYHAIEQQNYVNVCHLSIVISNFAFEVQMAVLTGNCGGITFRDDTIITAYHFRVCQDGTYQLYRYDSSNSHPIFASGSTSAIKTGLQQSNLLAVVAIGDNFDLYVNHQQIANVSDNKYQQGHIGLRVDGPAGEEIYSNAKMWRL